MNIQINLRLWYILSNLEHHCTVVYFFLLIIWSYFISSSFIIMSHSKNKSPLWECFLKNIKNEVKIPLWGLYTYSRIEFEYQQNTLKNISITTLRNIDTLTEKCPLCYHILIFPFFLMKVKKYFFNVNTLIWMFFSSVA